VQVKKDYYTPYREATKSLFVKPQEVEILSRMPGTAWASAKREFYPERG
jgi:hypothetical protein